MSVPLVRDRLEPKPNAAIAVRSSQKKSPDTKSGLLFTLLQRNSHFAVASAARARRDLVRRRERTLWYAIVSNEIPTPLSRCAADIKKAPQETGLSYLLQRNSHFAVASAARARRDSVRRRERTLRYAIVSSQIPTPLSRCAADIKKAPTKAGLSYLLQRNSHFAVASDARARRDLVRRRERTPGTRSSRTKSQRRYRGAQQASSDHKKSPDRSGAFLIYFGEGISPSRAPREQGGI